MAITPLVRAFAGDAIIWLKLEGHNPSGSIKDRLVAHLLVQALSAGTLRPGASVIEVSTGNSGIALARAAQLLGHACEVLLPATADAAIVQRIREHGAVPVLLPQERGPDYAFSLARQRAENGWFWPNQYTNPSGPGAYAGLAEEILHALPTVDCFVAGVGTGGTLCGVGSALRWSRGTDRMHVVAVEPEENESIDGLRNTRRMRIPGDIYPARFANETIRVSRHEAESGRRLLALQGIRCGASGGGVYLVAQRLAARCRYKTIVGICADGQQREADLEPSDASTEKGHEK